MTSPAPPLPPPAQAQPLPAPIEGAGGIRRLPGVPYAAIPGIRPLELDLYLPPAADAPAPVVVFLHGGGWRLGSRHLAGTGIDGTEIDVDVLATDPWSARMLLVDKYRGERVFLLGDAAHLNPPWGGHGFNTCIGDAVNLGWKLAAVLQGWAPETLLDSYEPERRPVALRTIDAAGSQEAFLAPSFAAADLGADSPAGAALRAEVAQALQVKDPEFHALGLVLGYDYPDSPVVVPDAGSRPAPAVVTYTPSSHAGARLPHAWLPDGTSIYDLLGDGFTLLRLAPAADAGPFLDAATRAGVPVRLLDLVHLPRLRARYGVDLLLVRPDQHVAWRGSGDADVDAVLDVVTGRGTRPATVAEERSTPALR